MEDVQKVDESSAAPSATDVEMEDVSGKIPEIDNTKDVEEPIDKSSTDIAKSVDIAEELKEDIALTSNNDTTEGVEDESMEVLDENKLLEDSQPDENITGEAKPIEDTKETEELLELNEDKDLVELNDRPTVLAMVTKSAESTEKLEDIENENVTLVLNSDVDSGSSEHDGEPVEDDYNEEENDEFLYDIISEGKAQIYIPAGKKGVFYNPVQEFNRDLSVAVLTVFAKDHQNDPTVKKYLKKMKWATATSETEDDEDEEEELEDAPPSPGKKCRNGISVLDALSATGLRSMRYGLEVAGVNTVMANDMSEVAVKIIDKNVKLNQLNKIVVSRRFDAIHLMQLEKIRGRHFDAIDIDPFGNPTRFLDAAVSSLRDGGLLLVTCTDMAVLCGNSPETCYVKYNAVSLKTAACHEMALRICLHLIETVCSKYGRFIAPLLSFHADFYIRVFVKVFTSPQTCKATSTKTSMVFKCIGCNTLSFQPLGMKYEVSGQNKFNLSHGPVVNAKCVHCEGRHVMAGPIWTGPLHDLKFVQEVAEAANQLELKNTRRITGMLAVMLEELEVPLYYTLTNLCSVLHCEVIPMQDFRSALLNANYQVSLSHCSKNSFKTDAPMHIVWDILRCWIKEHPVANKRLEDGTVRNLITKEPAFEADFTYHEESLPESAGLLRYQPNPEPYWGPGRKSTTNIGDARPKSNNIHNHKDDRHREEGESPQAKRFKNNSIELITLSDEEDGDSLDKEIFSLKAEGEKKEDVASLMNTIANNTHSKTNAASDKIIEEYNLCDDDTAVASKKTDRTIEEYTLCDDDDDDDLRIVNGDIKVTKQVDNKTLEDLEKELSQEIDAFDKKTKSALDIVESMEAAEKDEVVLEDLDGEEVEKNEGGSTEIAPDIVSDSVDNSGVKANDTVDSIEAESEENIVDNLETVESNGVHSKLEETKDRKPDGEVESVEEKMETDIVAKESAELEREVVEEELNGEKERVEKDILELESGKESDNADKMSEEDKINEDDLLKEDEEVKENGDLDRNKKLDEIEKELDTMISEEKSTA